MSASAPAPQPPSPLPVGATAQEVARILAARLRYLPRVALAPFTVAFVLDGVVTLGAGAAALLAVPLFVLAYTVFVVDWHRLVLLGPRPDTTSPRLRLHRRDLRFLGYGLLVGIIASVVGGLLTAAFVPLLQALPGNLLLVSLVAALVGVTGMLALGLVLPATAVDQPFGIGESWRATRGVLPSLLGLVAILIMPLQLVIVAIGAIHVAAAELGGLMVPVMLLGQAAQFLELAVIATLLSVVFRRRSGVDLTV